MHREGDRSESVCTSVWILTATKLEGIDIALTGLPCCWEWYAGLVVSCCSSHEVGNTGTCLGGYLADNLDICLMSSVGSFGAGLVSPACQCLRDEHQSTVGGSEVDGLASISDGDGLGATHAEAVVGILSSRCGSGTVETEGHHAVDVMDGDTLYLHAEVTGLRHTLEDNL